jgi:hypothetical protein
VGALPHLGGCRQIAGRPFAVKNGNRRRPSSLPAPSAPSEQASVAVATSEEQKLIQQAIAGDSEAQTRLFETYTPRLHRIAFNVLRNNGLLLSLRVSQHARPRAKIGAPTMRQARTPAGVSSCVPNKIDMVHDGRNANARPAPISTMAFTTRSVFSGTSPPFHGLRRQSAGDPAF